ncbi:hypothetical protein NSTC731_05985 [Nostoc sp. DSM 114167]
MYIPQGELMLENCEIASEWVGIFIQGQKTNPTVRQCKIHDGQSCGVLVTQKGLGVIEDCDIFANVLPGIYIGEGSNPTIRKCQIHDGQSNGIQVTDNGQGTIEDCDIFANAYPDIAITNGGNPTIRRCQIHDGQTHGIRVTDNGQGTIEDCDIFANTNSGILIDDGGNPTIRKCQIHNGQSNGIQVTDNGQGTIEDCDIFANAQPGIYIDNGGNPTICKCQIHDEQTHGILISDNGLGTIEDCDIFANAYQDIAITNGGNPTIRRCQIHDGQGNGIRVTNNGQGTIEDCDIFANAYPGIYIDNGGNPTIRKCQIHDGQSNGVMVTNNGRGTIEDCNVFDNKRQDWYIADDCIVSGYIENKENKNLKNNTISENISSKKSKKELTKESKEQNSNRTIKSDNSRLELLLDQLETMIGLDSVKEAVLEIVDTEIANQRLKKEGYEVEESQTRHMLFSGNPGTGKTTIARLIGQIFKELGILQKGEFIEVQRDSLVAIYLGQTASKTTELVESALDSVLFIDEAYSLANGQHDEYGREAINTLVALMENYRHRLVVIFAGYSNEMKSFLNSNSGLKSRIAFHIDFPDYTGEEMHSIFLTMCNNKKPGWICTENVSERLKTIFINMYENRGNNFANGRDVRNIFEKMVMRIKTRIVRENLSGESMRTFSLNDIPPELQ